MRSWAWTCLRWSGWAHALMREWMVFVEMGETDLRVRREREIRLVAGARGLAGMHIDKEEGMAAACRAELEEEPPRGERRAEERMLNLADA